MKKFSLFLIFFLLFVLVTVAGAAEVDSSSVETAPAKNIPLPRQTAYMGKGLSIGIGGGIYNPTEDCDCMGVWQGQLEYFYTDFLSAGIDVRFFGGDLNSDVMVMYQRYRANLRLHHAWRNVDVFVEPVLGFENTSLSEFRHQLENRGKVNEDSLMADTSETYCERMFSLDGFSVGLGIGVGANLSRLWGVTGSILSEYNFSEVVQVTAVPGVAFNLREVWPWAKKNLLSTWLSLSVGFQRYFNHGVGKLTTYGFIGIQLGA